MNTHWDREYRWSFRETQMRLMEAGEWCLLRPVDNYEAWYNALKNAINAPGMKMMCLYNWEFFDGPGVRVIEAANQVIAEGLKPRKLPPVEPGNMVKSLYEVKD